MDQNLQTVPSPARTNIPQVGQLVNGPRWLAAKAKLDCERLRAALAPSPNFGEDGDAATTRPASRSACKCTPRPRPPKKESHLILKSNARSTLSALFTYHVSLLPLTHLQSTLCLGVVVTPPPSYQPPVKRAVDSTILEIACSCRIIRKRSSLTAPSRYLGNESTSCPTYAVLGPGRARGTCARHGHSHDAHHRCRNRRRLHTRPRPRTRKCFKTSAVLLATALDALDPPHRQRPHRPPCRLDARPRPREHLRAHSTHAR
jgi:hypothetical protein